MKTAAVPLIKGLFGSDEFEDMEQTLLRGFDNGKKSGSAREKKESHPSSGKDSRT
jgi:hypothetical protein